MWLLEVVNSTKHILSVMLVECGSSIVTLNMTGYLLELFEFSYEFFRDSAVTLDNRNTV